ncbi:MAG TPA: NusA N-terminal domain-containing protein, partial [Thermodesulfovibrionia bacterium]|nr:NusA N-terminal domain-containing protein [Thermodesulfovibrionia bacterium]
MNQELLNLIEQISREKGIDKNTLIDNLETALISAVRKRAWLKNVSVTIDRERGEISITSLKTIVETVRRQKEEISIDEAQEIDPNTSVGETIPVPVSIEDFGRIAAQTAKQVLFQKVRESESEVIYEEYKSKEGH